VTPLGRVLVTEFESARCLYFLGVAGFVTESGAGFNTALPEDVTQVKRSMSATLPASPSVLRSRS
jgi:hypothetical protein